PYTFWTSNTMSGHSVDNLAPTPPLFLTAERAGADVHLSWGRSRSSDVKRYAVYRRTSKGVKPIGVDFVSSEEDTVAVDAAAPGSALYYIVTAYDVHGNQSIASNEAGVSATSGVGDTPPLTKLSVLQNRPNPFVNGTAIDIGLPAAARVEIEV